METLLWLLVAIAGPAIILLSIGYVAPLVLLEPQVIKPIETPQKPTERPTAAPSPTVIYVWPTLTPGTPTPMPIRYSNDEIDTLAAAIAYEALNQPIEGMAAVAEVVVRWAERDGKVFSEVLTEEFFGSEGGAEHIKAMKEWWKPDNNEIHMDIWATITLIAINVANGWLPEQCPGAMHFYNPELVEEPAWAKGKEPLCVIGDHWFYGGGKMEKLIESIAERMFGDIDEYTREIARASVKDVLSAVRDRRLDEELGVVGRAIVVGLNRKPFLISYNSREFEEAICLGDIHIALRPDEK